MFFKCLLVCACLIFSLRAEENSLAVLYLTWLHDPTSTMTIQWHSRDKEVGSQVTFRKIDDELWQEAQGISREIYKSDLLVHTVELEGLEPDSEYEFRVEKIDESYRFKTMPVDLSHPVKFVIGGDAFHGSDLFEKMNAQIAKQSPDFVVVGGDIAYTHGAKNLFKSRDWKIKRWRSFLKQWKSQLVTPDGRLIPLLAVLGNHDIRGSSLSLGQQNPLFYEIFALPEKGIPYRSLEFGDYMSLILLDSGHGFHIAGQQTQWLENQLSVHEKMPYKFAAYHISAYPSVYPFTGDTPVQIRKNRCPLFDRYQLNAAFEHHNHAYKRTFPLKNNEKDSKGVIYMGDGSWGVKPRKPKKLWYLEKSGQVNAVCVITLEKDSATIEGMNIKGKIFDSVSISPGSF